MHRVVKLLEKGFVIFPATFGSEAKWVNFFDARLCTRLRRGKQTFFNSG
jgi:hypothetical protein